MLIGLVVALPVGRWLALRTAEQAWAASLGVTATHTAIANLRLAVFGLVFLSAAAWAIGNLYLVYRSIGSVHVPRRLGNIEIVEAVPRRYLQLIVLGLGLLVATLFSVGSGDWWRDFALVGSRGGGELRDPILGRDLGYYLFSLPWQHRVEGLLTSLVAVVLVLTGLLHGLVGAVRWTAGRLETTDLARTHLATQLALLATVLFLGYRLDPLEYVGGLHNVPYDAVLVDVRLPVSGLLAGLSLAAAITSVVWIRLPRAAVAGVPWAALGVVALVGTYVVPGFAAAARSPDQRIRADLVQAQRTMLEHAYGMTAVETVLDPPPSPDQALLARHRGAISAVPVWDAPVLQGVLAGVGQDSTNERWTTPSLGVYWSERGGYVPAYIAVRERDLLAARETDPDLTWREVHVAPGAFGTGAVAVHATAVSETGLPLYLPDLARPDSSTSQVVYLALEHGRIAFSPGAEAFAILESTAAPAVGIRVGGAAQRLALAWALQSFQLLSSRAVSPGGTLLWPRGIGERLERLAPFLEFGAPYPAVIQGRIVWMAPGYVTAPAFPLSVVTEFAGRRVRAVRAGFVGTVDAHAGTTAVYLLPGADPLSTAWAELAPDVVRPAAQLPPDVIAQARYPEELFEAQIPMVVARGAQGLPMILSDGRLVSQDAARRPLWLPGAAVGGPPNAVALRAVGLTETGAVDAVVDGIMHDGAPRLRVVRLRNPLVPNRDAASEGSVAGRLRLLAFPEGLVSVVPVFAGRVGDSDLPRLEQVAILTGDIAARGATLDQAMVRLHAALGAPPAASAQWLEARRWFERMDQARQAADWAEFGRAWQELRRVLGVPRDSAP